MAYNINGMISSLEDIAALFGNSTEPEEVKEEKETVETKETEEEEQEEITDVKDLFSLQEKVGDEEDNSDEEEGVTQPKEGSSPKNNLYSSIANSLVEEGTLSYLSEDDIKEIKDSESLIEAMKKQVNNMLEDSLKRIKEALDYGVLPTIIQQYENTLNYLSGISNEALEAENEDGELLRKQIIYQYEINHGADENRAKKMVERAISGGTDIEDAKECLEDLKTFYKESYDSTIKQQKELVEKNKKSNEELVAKFKDRMLKDSDILGSIEVDTRTRQQAFDNLMKPTFKDEKGNIQTAIQKAMSENPREFNMKVALLYTITNGFKDMDKLVKSAVKKEKKKTLRELEHVINNTQRTPDGVLNLKGFDDDSSFLGMKIAPPEMWNK